MLGELTATLAHDLNLLLTAILSNAQAARRFIGDGGIEVDELRAILDDIIRDDKRAGGVIHNLRRMLNNTPIAPEACSLNDLVREVAEFVNGEMIDRRSNRAGSRRSSATGANGSCRGPAGPRQSPV
jgi:signal transduction histidine kinase